MNDVFRKTTAAHWCSRNELTTCTKRSPGIICDGPSTIHYVSFIKELSGLLKVLSYVSQNMYDECQNNMRTYETSTKMVRSEIHECIPGHR